MELRIDGETVATYQNIGGNADNGTFASYTYNVDGISADRIQVAFTNDLFDDASGTDRNLRVDGIVVDGVNFQTDDPSVFSNGTWTTADGLAPGFGRGDTLHSDGYFQYAGDSNNGSLIRIRANGQTGQESMSLQIDGQTVQTWNNVGTTDANYDFTASGTVTPDRIRVTFNNDFVDEAAGTDRNLRVDYIEVDGARRQTEASSVFSTGTWSDADGTTPGFGRGDTLTSNGYFQYDAASSGSSITVFAAGDEGDENIELQIDGSPSRSGTTLARRNRRLPIAPSNKSRLIKFVWRSQTTCSMQRPGRIAMQ